MVKAADKADAWHLDLERECTDSLKEESVSLVNVSVTSKYLKETPSLTMSREVNSSSMRRRAGSCFERCSD
jgi:hypothetical protein